MLRYKRLEKGRFRWPEAVGGQAKVVLSHEELALLLGGIDLAETRRRRWYRNMTQDRHRYQHKWLLKLLVSDRTSSYIMTYSP